MNGGAKTQEGHAVGPLFVQRADCALRDGQLLLGGIVLIHTAVEADQIHMHLDRVKRSFRGCGGQIGQRGDVFLDRVLGMVLELGDLSANGMEAVIVRLNTGDAREEGIGAFIGTRRHFRLGR